MGIIPNNDQPIQKIETEAKNKIKNKIEEGDTAGGLDRTRVTRPAAMGVLSTLSPEGEGPLCLTAPTDGKSCPAGLKAADDPSGPSDDPSGPSMITENDTMQSITTVDQGGGAHP